MPARERHDDAPAPHAPAGTPRDTIAARPERGRLPGWAPRVSVAHRSRLMTDLGGGGAAGQHGDVLDPLCSRLDRVAHERERAPLALHHELLLVKRTCASGHGLSGWERRESASPALIELAAACAGRGSSPAGQPRPVWGVQALRARAPTNSIDAYGICFSLPVGCMSAERCW